MQRIVTRWTLERVRFVPPALALVYRYGRVGRFVSYMVVCLVSQPHHTASVSKLYPAGYGHCSGEVETTSDVFFCSSALDIAARLPGLYICLGVLNTLYNLLPYPLWITPHSEGGGVISASVVDHFRPL